MGYRSDVALGVAFPSVEALIAFVTKVKLSGNMLPSEWGWYRVTKTDGGDGALLHATFHDVKWYENYPDVQCHLALIGQAEDDGLDRAFVRIGEDYADVEVSIYEENSHADLYSFFGVHRGLIAPEGGEPLVEGDN